MKKNLTLFVLSLLFFSCNQGTKSSAYKPDYSSPEKLIKSYYEYSLTTEEYPVFFASMKFQRDHKDEILKTLEIVEKIEIPKTAITLVLYRYSIGADFKRGSFYLRKIGNEWYMYDKYFSSYDDDPFKNGNGSGGKAILKKKDDWTSESNDVWWN